MGGAAGLIPPASGRAGRIRSGPAPASGLVGQGIPGEVGEEAVEPPSAPRRIGTGRFHRIAYRRETTLEPDPVVAQKVSRTKKALHHKQPPGHPVAALPEPERRRLESPQNFSPRPHITSVNING
jgi:hypothetical protein